jgi:hypothetical protein
VILVLPGGGYSHLAPHEGIPVAEWLESLGWRARVVEYPVATRHPGPIDSVQRLSPPGLGIMADDLLAGVVAGAMAYSASALLGW